MSDEDEQPRRKRGRPRKHPDIKATRRAASKAYRARQKALKEARRAGLVEPLHSDVIFLGHLPPWKRK
jgi:LmbE family N-acetylglucosaminyl deacetylase